MHLRCPVEFLAPTKEGPQTGEDEQSMEDTAKRALRLAPRRKRPSVPVRHEGATVLKERQMQMHGLVDDAFCETQCANPVVPFGNRDEDSALPHGLAVADVVAILGVQEMDAPRPVRDESSELGDIAKHISDLFKQRQGPGTGESQAQTLPADMIGDVGVRLLDPARKPKPLRSNDLRPRSHTG